MSAENNKVGLIVAMDTNRGIGFQGKMPWHNREELRHFRMATKDRVLIVGSRTADSLIDLQGDFEDRVYSPEEQIVLKGRKLIVVTRKEHVRDYVRLGLYVAGSLEEAITKAHELADENADIAGLSSSVYLAGGGQLYKEALEKDLIDFMMVSTLVSEYPCDTKFPDFDLEKWEYPYILLNEPTFNVKIYVKKEESDEPALYSS